MKIIPFRVNVPGDILDDLKKRLEHVRWPDAIEGSGWEFGSDLAYMKELVGYWKESFDWRKTEEQINSYPNFIAEVDGYQIHFLHIRGKGKNPVPLLALHGWPGSFLELMKLIPLLTGADEPSFDLVIPSLIGYGFSQKATRPGCDLFLMADLFNKLMKGLGYKRFGLHGGDFGSGVATAMAMKHPEDISGIHLNYIESYFSPFLDEGEKLSEEETGFLVSSKGWDDREGAYAHQQRTRPLTLAYGLNDSPVGLCAWIVEKFRNWSDCKGNVENVFTKDEILSDVTLYWITETIHSSIRLYHESRNSPLVLKKGEFIRVPAGIARFPLEEPFPPRQFIERGFQIAHWTNMPAGGHFAAMEQPQLLAKDIRKFFQIIYPD